MRRPGIVDDLCSIDALGQEADAPINLAQPPLSIQVISVLRAVAIGRGPRDSLDDTGTLDLPEVRALVTEALEAGGEM